MDDVFSLHLLSPMLIANEQPAFNDANYIYELKLDGTRCLAYLDKDTRLFNKRKLEITKQFPELSKLHTMVKHRCVLDGELFVYHHDHVDFFASQRRSLTKDPFKIRLAASQMPASFTAFDILYDDNCLVNEESLMQRKQRLAKIIKAENERFSISRYIEENGIALFQLTTQKQLEGIVAKRKDSTYTFAKRTKDWIKCKNWEEDDFVICGYIEKEKGILSYVLGQYQNDRLIYKGHVTMGATQKFLHSYPLEKGSCPFDTIPEGNKQAVWLKPQLVAIVSYMEKNTNGGLRQPVCRGIRDDKDPKACSEKK